MMNSSMELDLFLCSYQNIFLSPREWKHLHEIVYSDSCHSGFHFSGHTDLLPSSVPFIYSIHKTSFNYFYARYYYSTMLLSNFGKGTHYKWENGVFTYQRRELTLGLSRMMTRLWLKHRSWNKTRNQRRNVTWSYFFRNESKLFPYNKKSER